MGNISSSNRTARTGTPEFRGASAFERTPSVVESVTSVATAKTTPPARTREDHSSSSAEDDDSTVSTASCSRTGSSSTSSNDHGQMLKTDGATKATKSRSSIATTSATVTAATVTTRARKRKWGFESSLGECIGEKPSQGPQPEAKSRAGEPIAKRACSLEEPKIKSTTTREEPENSCTAGGKEKRAPRSVRLRRRSCTAVRGIQAQEGKSSRWCWNSTEDEHSSTNSYTTHPQAENIEGCNSDATSQEAKHGVDNDSEIVARESESDESDATTDDGDVERRTRYKRVGPAVDDKTPDHIICDGDGGEILVERRPVYYDHAKWHKYFKYLRKHLRKYNKIRMDSPYDFRMWTERQQTLYQKGMLLEKRKAKLDSIGFNWKQPVRYTWEEMFDRFMAYKKRYKRDTVPRRSKLSSWIKMNRSGARHKGKNPSGRGRHRILSDERRAKLNAIGFKFVVKKRTNWDDMFRLLVAYKQKHNTLVVSPHNSPLGMFVKISRRQRKLGHLEKEKIDALNSIGFDWEPQNSQDSTWKKMFDIFVAYKKKHPLGDVPMERELESWVRTQRRQRLSESESARLSYKRICTLDSVGFEWDGPKKRIGINTRKGGFLKALGGLKT